MVSRQKGKGKREQGREKGKSLQPVSAQRVYLKRRKADPYVAEREPCGIEVILRAGFCPFRLFVLDEFLTPANIFLIDNGILSATLILRDITFCQEGLSQV